MGRQCGICGNMDMDSNPETEFYRLDSDKEYYEPELNIRKAFHSYTIKDDTCSRPENFEEMCKDEMCEYERTAYPNEYRNMRDPYDLPEQLDYRTEIKPVRKVRKIERHGKLCFSTRPILTCPSHTYPTGVKKTEEVTFKCPSKYSSYWGSYESSSSSSSDSTESANERLGASGSSSSDSSPEASSSSSESTSTSRPSSHNVRRQPKLKQPKSASSSSSESRSESTSSSERFYDSASDSRDNDKNAVAAAEFTMTVTIPEGCRKL
jgi:hypothetical protein